MARMSRYALIWSFISWVALACNKGILLFMGRFMVIRLVVSPGSGSGKIWVSAVLVTSEEFFPHIDSSYSNFLCDRVDTALEVMVYNLNRTPSHIPCVPLAIFPSPCISSPPHSPFPNLYSSSTQQFAPPSPSRTHHPSLSSSE